MTHTKRVYIATHIVSHVRVRDMCEAMSVSLLYALKMEFCARYAKMIFGDGCLLVCLVREPIFF